MCHPLETMRTRPWRRGARSAGPLRRARQTCRPPRARACAVRARRGLRHRSRTSLRTRPVRAARHRHTPHPRPNGTCRARPNGAHGQSRGTKRPGCGVVTEQARVRADGTGATPATPRTFREGARKSLHGAIYTTRTGARACRAHAERHGPAALPARATQMRGAIRRTLWVKRLYTASPVVVCESAPITTPPSNCAATIVVPRHRPATAARSAARRRPLRTLMGMRAALGQDGRRQRPCDESVSSRTFIDEI